MQSSQGPIVPPKPTDDPGMARPIVALSMVFIIGLACVLIIYAMGEPIRESNASPTDTQTQAEDASASAPVASADNTAPPTDAAADSAVPVKPTGHYVSAGGGEPLPDADVKEPPTPIAPAVLIDDAAYNARPPEPSTLPQPDGPVPWSEAHKYLGMTITVDGTVVDTNNIGNICFLNFDTDWQDKFYVALFKEAFSLLPDPPETHYLNKHLLITGKVKMYKDRPEIEVHDVSQIEVVE